MKRRNKQIVGILIIVAVALLVYGYIRFFNGTLIYISTGLKNDTIMKVDTDKTSTMEADILLADAKAEYENVFGTDVWSQTMDSVNFDDYVKDKVRSKLIRIRCMNLMAKKKGVVLSRTEKEAVTNAVEAYMAKLTDDQKQQLSITQDKLTAMFTEFAIANELYEDMTSSVNTEISADDARVISIQYICAQSQDDINAAKQKLDSGESFYTVAKEYNGSDDYETELKRGQMDSAFENAAFDLKSGETSGIVSAGNKYYIIKCTSDNEKSKTESNKNALVEEKKLNAFNNSFESYEASKYVEWNNSVWDKKKASDAASLSVSFEDTFNSYFK